MDIKFENGIKTELFCNIGKGECFVVDFNTPDEMICMRIFGYYNKMCNAVELQSGEAVHFDNDDEVIPIDIELKARLGG